MSDGKFRCQDEILQLMYWMRAECLGSEPTAAEINRFLMIEQVQLEKELARLASLDLVEMRQGSGGESRFELTPRGIEEGRRRFQDEFSAYLGKESHIECGDPDCDCHAPGWDGVCHSRDGKN